MKSALRSSVASVLVLCLLACFSQSQIAALASILGSTAASIAAIEGNPTLATKLTTDTAAAVAAINAWKSGTPDSEVILALNLVEDDLNLFPSTGPYVPLIDLAIGTVESILALLPQSSSAIAPHAVHRAVVLPFPAPKTASAYKGQWNVICSSDSRLAALKVK